MKLTLCALLATLPLVAGAETVPASGVLPWIPNGMNYVESPWAMKYGNEFYLGGHAGFCCVWGGHDLSWVMLFYPTGSSLRTSIALPGAAEADDHEVGGYSPLYLGGRWWMLGARTELSYWGQGNRLRAFTLHADSPFAPGGWVVDRTPLFYPSDTRCQELGDVDPACVHSIGAGQNGSLLTTRDGRVLMLSKDDVGYLNFRLHSTSSHVVHLIDPVKRTATFQYVTDWGVDELGREYVPSFSEWARGRDGRIYGYTGTTSGLDWYGSRGVVEWVTDDEGLTWRRTGRSWSDGTDACIWDAAVLKDAGGVRVEPMVIFAVRSPRQDGACQWATSGQWRIWWWAEDRDALPAELRYIPRRRLSTVPQATGIIP